MRYPDAVRFNNLIMWAAGTTGPMVPPGTYTVRMTVNGAGAFFLRSAIWYFTFRIVLTALFAALTVSRIFMSSANCAASSAGVAGIRGSFLIANVCVCVLPSAVMRTL